MGIAYPVGKCLVEKQISTVEHVLLSSASYCALANNVFSRDRKINLKETTFSLLKTSIRRGQRYLNSLTKWFKGIFRDLKDQYGALCSFRCEYVEGNNM
jgi:hypothetical protein